MSSLHAPVSLHSRRIPRSSMYKGNSDAEKTGIPKYMLQKLLSNHAAYELMPITQAEVLKYPTGRPQPSVPGILKPNSTRAVLKIATQPASRSANFYLHHSSQQQM